MINTDVLFVYKISLNILRTVRFMSRNVNEKDNFEKMPWNAAFGKKLGFLKVRYLQYL